MIRYRLAYVKFRWNAVFSFGKNLRIGSIKRCLFIRFGYHFYVFDLWNLKRSKND